MDLYVYIYEARCKEEGSLSIEYVAIAPFRLYTLTFVHNLLRKFVVYFRADSIPMVQRPVQVVLVCLWITGECFIQIPTSDRVTTAYQTTSEPFGST